MRTAVSRFRRVQVWICVSLALCMLLPGATAAAEPKWAAKEAEIERWITERWQESDIPGMSIVVTGQDGIIFEQHRGYSDKHRSVPVTGDTRFELGSLSKAFTGLAILDLEKQGKLRLTDPVRKYLPWLQLTYKGDTPDITIEQLLYQTSGIPFQSIGTIPEGSGEAMLEQTVRTLVGMELEHRPGEEFLYATINYDVLGLVIEQIEGVSFGSYLHEHVISPLGLSSTFAGYEQLPPGQTVSQGFKMGYLSARAYDSPAYSGNTPAGYVLSTAYDLAKWMRIQLGLDSAHAQHAYDAERLSELLARSHVPDRSVPPGGDGSSYAAGWAIHQKGEGEWSHGGTNPTFSAYIVLRPEEQLGVAVLANMNSDLTYQMGQGVMDMLLDKEVEAGPRDYYTQMDRIGMCLLIFALLAGIGLGYAYVLFGLELYRRQRRFAGVNRRVVQSLLISVGSLAVCLTGLYFIPHLLFQDLPWSFVKVWASPTITVSLAMIAVVSVLYAVWTISRKLFPKAEETPFVTVATMSLLSGFGNAFIVFMINESFRHGEQFPADLFLYFVLGIVFYVYAQKIVRTQLVRYANHLLYEKRMSIVDRILSSRFAQVDRMEAGKVNAALISDTETISGALNVAISGITSIITLVFCFIYLGFINLYGLLLSTLIILAAASIYYVAFSKVQKLWEYTRDVQNVFFSFVNDLLKGFKELSLHASKRRQFRADMEANSRVYKEKRSQGDVMFANVYVIGELMFTVVIGVVAFLFPLLFKQMGAEHLRNYVFVFLYMTGPINGVLHAIPQMLNIRISWRRVNTLIRELEEELPADAAEHRLGQPHSTTKLRLDHIEYKYGGETDFRLGPIDYEFRTGEVVFITGGNGSGKSTLSKLITGLCVPDIGTVSINGTPVEGRELGEWFSVVFSDFHLFNRLYGIHVEGREEEVRDYLRLLQLEDKVELRDGSFSTTKLSSGQRKRLALLLCYLDDRPFYLFDEWAADQDPEYREYFYTHLLARMKQQGKGVIAITHDDRYFHLADKVIKLEMGQVVPAAQYVS